MTKTEKERLEEEITLVDRQITDLASRSSGFDLASEIRRLRSVLFGRDKPTSSSRPSQFPSKHDTAEQIKELQREREQLLNRMSEGETEETAASESSEQR